MKNILITGPVDDPFHIPQITKAAVENSGGQAFFSLDPSDITACDGLILPGGLPDIAPANYGERNVACNMTASPSPGTVDPKKRFDYFISLL